MSDPAVVSVAQVDSTGRLGPTTSATLDIRDTTPPSVTVATSIPRLGVAKLVFSEALEKASAESPSNYTFASGERAKAAKLGS
ncbi:hypothetical protein ABTL42_19175, partial [Acinetobacter baumannii]